MLNRFSHLAFVALFAALLAMPGAAHGQGMWYVDDDAPGDPGPGDLTVSDPLEDGSAAYDAVGTSTSPQHNCYHQTRTTTTARRSDPANAIGLASGARWIDAALIHGVNLRQTVARALLAHAALIHTDAHSLTVSAYPGDTDPLADPANPDLSHNARPFSECPDPGQPDACANPSTPSAAALSFPITQNSDDGTELDGATWYESGCQILHDNRVNHLGRDPQHSYDVGLRFHVDNLAQGEQVVYARIRLASHGSNITSGLSLAIAGVLQDAPTTFSQDDRPSQKLPHTNATVAWHITDEWELGHDRVPLYYSSPDISPILNEILSLTNWGADEDDTTMAITVHVHNSDPQANNTLYFEDVQQADPESPATPAVLEVYKTVYDTFLGRELLGRITDCSATINLYSLLATDIYVQYGTESGEYDHSTAELLDNPAEQAIDLLLPDLEIDTHYYYRLAYRTAGHDTYSYGEEHTFRTQRPAGQAFGFAITADEHLQNMLALPMNTARTRLYRQTLANIAERDYDFHISLGDFAHPEFAAGRDAANLQEARERYLQQRAYIDAVGHSTPFYLVIGNHEGEQGWYYDFNTPGENYDSLAVWATKARKEMIPNPYPNGFYAGNEDVIAEYGLREDYFAWRWGDALFVVLDPFWYTRTEPQQSRDNWDWTLGKAQYDWLHETLHNSAAKWKFVFIHHLTSSNEKSVAYKKYYGRGGIEVAKYKVDRRASYEWGGEEDMFGYFVFSNKRPGWSHGPTHDMLVGKGVDIVFHGHDHLFAKQDLDGMVYQECPMPSDARYTYGRKQGGKYIYGELLPNSGHVEVTVGPEYVRVDYIRAYLPGDGENGEVAYTYFVGIDGDLDQDGDVDLSDLARLLGWYGEDAEGGDVDGDGDTDGNDLNLLLENYGVDYS